jgi:phosphoribosylformylglycinamidine cyclo-ligase
MVRQVTRAKQTYAAAGVDISAADRAKELIKKHARTTLGPEVLSDIGFFGGLFEIKGYREPVLVASTDGVGTKLKIASILGKHDTVGIDLVNHCVNDILTCGAQPLFILDYIALGKMSPETVESIVKGLAKACREVNCALIGGETAEMPGMYARDDYDLAGFIVGVVEKSQRLDPSRIREGDAILALPSSGLHTNGYSLARKVFGQEPGDLNKRYPQLGRSLGEALLEPHRCYFNQIKPVLPWVKGLAHITGGGFEGNVPRVLPKGLGAHFEKGAWAVPPIFPLIQRQGNIADDEMYRVFNMGVGMAIVCSPEDVRRLRKSMPEAKTVGEVIKHKGKTRVLID